MTSASLLLGLSRKPFSPALSARADQMLRTGAAPTRQGLALLSESSVEATLKLDGGVAFGESEPLPPVPPHPSYATLDTALGSLYSDLHAIGAHGAEGFFNRRGLLLPSPYLLPALATLKSQRELRASHLSVLGPRGAYLMSLTAQSPFSSGDPSLPSRLRAAFAKTASDRDVKLRPLLIGFALGTAQASGLSPKLADEYRSIVAERIARSDCDTLAKRCMALLLQHNQLVPPALIDRLAALLSQPSRSPPPVDSHPTQPLSPQLADTGDSTPGSAVGLESSQAKTSEHAHHRLLVQQLLLAASRLGDVDLALRTKIEAEIQKARELLRSLKSELANGLDPGRFLDLALAAHLAQASATAAQLFHAAIHDGNLLLGKHPALPVCLAAMGAEDYARSISHFASASKAGWADPYLTALLSVGTHTLNLEDSQHLATDTLRGLAPGRAALGRTFILKLHPETISLIHEYERKPHYGSLPAQMLSVLAKAAEVDRVYPASPV